MYEPDGHMCAEIMNPDRAAWKNPAKPTDEEKITAFNGFIAYCGTYKLDAEHFTVTHYPEVALNPPWVGSTQPRPFRIEGKRLIITPATTEPNEAKYVLRGSERTSDYRFSRRVSSHPIYEPDHPDRVIIIRGGRKSIVKPCRRFAVRQEKRKAPVPHPFLKLERVGNRVR